MGEIVARLVEKNVPQTAAQNNPENAVKEHVVDIARVPTGQQILPRAILAKNDEQNKSDQVHQAVPTHGDRAKLERNRIELGMNDHREKTGEAAASPRALLKFGNR